MQIWYITNQKSSEPAGEGAVHCIVIMNIGDDNVDNDQHDGGGGGHSVHCVQISNIWCGLSLGAADDFLGVALVEHIDKRLIFGIDYGTNR